LRQTDQRLKGVDWPTIRTSRALWEELRQLQSTNEQLGSIFVLDPQGRTALTTRVFPTPGMDFTDRDYFIAQKERDAGLSPARSYTGRISDDPIFNFSIRRSNAGGAFDGVIGSSPSVAYFENFYKSVGVPEDNFAVLLMRSDGNILARYPGVAPGSRS